MGWFGLPLDGMQRGIEFHKLVDSMGSLAWAAIFDQFVPAMAGTKPSFFTKNIYVGMNIHFNADVQVGFTPDFENPDPATFPKLQISMEYVDTPAPGATPQKPASPAAPAPES